MVGCWVSAGTEFPSVGGATPSEDVTFDQTYSLLGLHWKQALKKPPWMWECSFWGLDVTLICRLVKPRYRYTVYRYTVDGTVYSIQVKNDSVRPSEIWNVKTWNNHEELTYGTKWGCSSNHRLIRLSSYMDLIDSKCIRLESIRLVILKLDENSRIHLIWLSRVVGFKYIGPEHVIGVSTKKRNTCHKIRFMLINDNVMSIW